MRTWNSLKNIITGFGGQLLNIILSFILRTVFIYTLSKAYTGISGLFSSILTMLNLSELGLNSAIVFAMYKPAAVDDRETIRSLMNFYRKAYRAIGCVIFGLGLALMPALPHLIKGGTDLVNLRLIYMLYVLETASSYWFFAYKNAILQASQKDYVVSLVRYAGSLATAAVRVGMLLLLRETPTLSFYVYTIIGALGNVLKNMMVSRRVDRLFPYLRDPGVRPLEKDQRQGIYKNVVGMAANKICMVLNDGIDSTIISAFMGLNAVAVFSNYIMIKNYVNHFLSTVFGSISASVGNLCAVESTEKKISFFHSLQLVYFWFYGFCAICFWMLYNSFIGGVWLDESWLLPGGTVLLLTANFLIEGIAGAVVKYRDANGLFWQTKYRYIFSSVLNAGLSILLVGPAGLGVAGALLGTTVSLLVMLSWDPVLVYRTVFHKKAGSYYRMYLKYFLLAVGTGVLVHVLGLPFRALTPGNFLARFGLCLVVPNGLWYLIFRKRPEFLYFKNVFVNVKNKLRKK